MEKKIINYNALDEHQGERVDVFLNKKIISFSRSRIQALIKDGYVKINNSTNKQRSKKIKINDKITVEFPPPTTSKILPYKITLNILYEDRDLALINKNPGIVVHPGAGNYTNTLVNGLLHHYKNNLSSVGGKLRPGIVHRIDKDTSGLIVIAKNDNAHKKLSEQFLNHSIKRSYEALIWGIIRPLNGKISENISRSKKNRQLMSVSINRGKKAITNYKTIKIYRNKNIPTVSLIECQLETGRTHQIRVHMAFKGKPILGDKSYGKKKKLNKNMELNLHKNLMKFNRQALHAKSLGFVHPGTGKEVFFEAERPKDLKELIKNLNKASI